MAYAKKRQGSDDPCRFFVADCVIGLIKSAEGVKPKKVIVSQRRYERIYKRIADVNVPFSEKEEQGSGRIFFLKKKNGAKRTLLRRGCGDGI